MRSHLVLRAKFQLGFAFLFYVITVSSAVGQVRCTGISQGYIDKPDDKVTLTVDLPKGSSFLVAKLYTRTKDQKSWGDACAEGKTCKTIEAPQLGVPGGEGGGNDGTRHIEADVLPHRSGVFYTLSWARLEVTYSLPGNVCKVMQYFEANANSNAAVKLLVPPKKNVLGYQTYATELQLGHTWKLCDSTTGDSPLVFNKCDASVIGGLTFSLTGVTDDADGASGYNNTCLNKSGDKRRGCRVVLLYKP